MSGLLMRARTRLGMALFMATLAAVLSSVSTQGARSAPLPDSRVAPHGHAAENQDTASPVPPSAMTPLERERLTQGQIIPGVPVFPPTTPSGASPVVVMLHGMCGTPDRECPAYAPATSANAWLICPRGGLRCPGGGATWSGPGTKDIVEKSISEAASRYPTRIDTSDRILIGFSLGALQAMELAHNGQGRWRGLVLVGAKVWPDPVRLRKAGVERVVLAAGEYDMMKPHMEKQAKRLARAGYPAIFISLGKVGHRFPEHYEDYLSRALQWVRTESSSPN